MEQSQSSLNDELFVVGIASSAGGLEPLFELIANAYCHRSMCFVLVPHLSREYETKLPEILKKYSGLKSRLIENGMALSHCTLNVIPPNAYVETDGKRLFLIPRPSGGTNQAANILFKSIAQSFRKNAIGVVLSGSAAGADGSQGVIAIKQAGGHTYAQDPETAIFPDMPTLAINTGCIDAILPADQIGQDLSLVTWTR